MNLKDKLKISIRQHFPSFYNFVWNCRWKAKDSKANLFGTRIEEKRWAKRNFEQVKKGFSNLNHPHRRFLIERIKSFYPFSDILEIGCGYGPNLYLLSKKFPKTELTGIDINPLSVEEGNKWFAQQGILNVKLLVGKADKLSQFPDKNFDIVITDALLMYVGPDKIKKTIEEMLRISAKALVLTERHCQPQNKDQKGKGTYRLGYWKRDYLDLLKQFVPKEKIRVIKIPEQLWEDKNWKKFGYVIEVIK